MRPLSWKQLAVLALVAVGLGACTREQALELRLEGGLGDGTIRYRLDVHEGARCPVPAGAPDASIILGEDELRLSSGTFAFVVVGRNDACQVVFEGCTEVTTEEQEGPVVVSLREVIDGGFCPTEAAECRMGQCVDGDRDAAVPMDATLDGGPDAQTPLDIDAGLDAGSAPLDSGTDAGPGDGGGVPARDCAPPALGGSTPLEPSIVASVIEGVAPLAVHFDASGTTYAGDDIPGLDPFRDIEYRWHFGDVRGDCADERVFATGDPMHRAQGPITAHVFETPNPAGYLVRLTVRVLAPGGVVHVETTEARIRVHPTATTPPGYDRATETVCLTTSSSDLAACNTECGSGTCSVVGASVNATLSSLLTEPVSGGRRLRQILFRKGETFVFDGELTVSRPDILLGAFGPSTTPPLLDAPSAVSQRPFFRVRASDFRAAYLDFRCPALGPEIPAYAVVGQDNYDRTALVGLRLSNCGFFFRDDGSAMAGADDVTLATSEITVTDAAARARVDGTLRRAALIGNEIESGGGEAVIFSRLDQSAVIFNRFTHSGSVETTGPMLHQRRGERFVIAGNQFVQPTSGAMALVSSESDPPECNLGVVERNFIRAGALSNLLVDVEGGCIDVRNNILDVTDLRSGRSGGSNIGIAVTTPSDQIRVDHNTCVNTESEPVARGNCIQAGASGRVSSSRLCNNLSLGTTAAFPIVETRFAGCSGPADYESVVGRDSLRGYSIPASPNPMSTCPGMSSEGVDTGGPSRVLSDFFTTNRADRPDVGACEWVEP